MTKWLVETREFGRRDRRWVGVERWEGVQLEGGECGTWDRKGAERWDVGRGMWGVVWDRMGGRTEDERWVSASLEGRRAGGQEGRRAGGQEGRR